MSRHCGECGGVRRADGRCPRCDGPRYRNPGPVRRLKCRVGLHRGNVQPAHELDVDVTGRSAFECNYCGAVVDEPDRAFGAVERLLGLLRRVP